ncbi:MAG: sigma-70 family RNA polymerase sigma factor [Cytophagales bacterium]|nr:MAG: sigma-70 family RNA polymerase sigma factor [Cytophagales bacterium]
MENYKKIDDSTLVKMYQKGDESAFEQLLQRHKSKAFTAILLIVKDYYTAEDLLQETFIKIIQTIKGGKYNEEGKFQPWVVRIAHNLAIDYFRREKRYPVIMMEDGTSLFNNLKFAEESVESLQVREELHSQLKFFIQRLPEKQREVLIMRHYADMSFQEIAKATDVSVNTALGRMRYALINIKKQIHKYGLNYEKKFQI